MKTLKSSRRAAWLALLALTALTAARAAGKETMQLTSPAFAEGQWIPREQTRDGDDVSPALQWQDVPAPTKSFALICDDPDAPNGTWVHWVIYGVPAAARELNGAVPSAETLPDGARQGLNDFHRVGYRGPSPPPGIPHHYFFKLYALDTVLTLKPRATKAELLEAMAGHVVAEARLMGIYQRGK